MKVSVIIPVYNVSKYIEKSINCICNQTMQEGVECIIVNDCTPDDSIVKAKRIIDAYNGSVVFKIIDHEKNRGLAASRSTGMKYATGDYVLHLDSDDYYEYNMIEELYQSVIENDAEVSICNFYNTYIDRETIYTVNEIKNNEEYVRFLIRHKYDETIWNIWNKMFKRTIFIINNISWTEGIDYGEDNLICMKLFCFIKKTSKVNKPLYHYTHYNINSYTNVLNNIGEKKMISVLKDFECFLKDKLLYSKFENEINYRKNFIKVLLLRTEDYKSRAQFVRLFPESFKYIKKTPDISIYAKIQLYVAHISINIFNILEKIRKMIIKCVNSPNGR